MNACVCILGRWQIVEFWVNKSLPCCIICRCLWQIHFLGDSIPCFELYIYSFTGVALIHQCPFHHSILHICICMRTNVDGRGFDFKCCNSGWVTHPSTSTDCTSRTEEGQRTNNNEREVGGGRGGGCGGGWGYG